MFQKTQIPGVNPAFPDVNVTPPPPPPPRPMPYPNVGVNALGIPTQVKVLVLCTPAHNIGTTIARSNGDEPGCAPGGVASGTFGGPVRNTKCSTNTLWGGLPGTRMLDTSLNNTTNAPAGVTATPSQTKVLSLK